jgi:hypothetical protein
MSPTLMASPFDKRPWVLEFSYQNTLSENGRTPIDAGKIGILRKRRVQIQGAISKTKCK